MGKKPTSIKKQIVLYEKDLEDLEKWKDEDGKGASERFRLFIELERRRRSEKEIDDKTKIHKPNGDNNEIMNKDLDIAS